MADAEIKIKISKDPSSDLDKALVSTEQQASKLAQTIEDQLGSRGSSALGNLSSLASSELALSFGAVGLAVVALKKELDFTLEAEKIQQIHNSFEAIAESARLSGSALESGLAKAVDGLADDEAVLQAATRAIVQLGDKASVLPQIMENARKATSLFGGDLVQNFSSMNDAIAAGNVRALRQFGIIIDSDSAIKAYAKSLGVSAAELTEHGKKSAIAAAAIDAMNKKFAGIDESAVKGTNAVTRMKVAIGELGEQVAKTFSFSKGVEWYSGMLKEDAEVWTGLLKRMFGTDLEKAGQGLQRSQDDVKHAAAIR